MLSTVPLHQPLHHTQAVAQSQANAMAALERGHFFKLICGGSLTDLPAIEGLAACYGPLPGVDCIDIAPELAVVERLASQLEAQKAQQPEAPIPLLMVSLPLDPDPHFRKIDFQNTACIGCNACIPVCPTEALSEGFAPEMAQIEVNQPKCYGCSRCVDVCPTDALSLFPIFQKENFQAVLSHPWVGAVEIHTRYADAYMLPEFLNQAGPYLQDKLVSVCFRPSQIQQSQWWPFLEALQQVIPLPLLLQVDGQPMSGSIKTNQSLPALESARTLIEQTQASAPLGKPPFQWVTISGGIHPETALFLQKPEYQSIQGVGIGTTARELVWQEIQQGQMALAQEKAQQVINAFKAKKR